MTKIYTYKNATIHVVNTNINKENLHKATEKFIKKVLKERTQNGNNHSSRSFKEK